MTRVIFVSGWPRGRCDNEDSVAAGALCTGEIRDSATLTSVQEGREMDDGAWHQDVRPEPQTIGICW